MTTYLYQAQYAISLIKSNIPFALFLILGLWVILIINKLLGYRLNRMGILPRYPIGLVGIPLHPFIHGSFNHLFFNTFPLFVLLTFILAAGLPSFLCITCSIVFLSGMAIWLLGRKAIHIGASDLIMGYWAFLLVNAYQHPSLYTLVLAVICLYYFGGLVFSIFPTEEKISWEGHLFGLLAGVMTTYICPVNTTLQRPFY